MVVYFSGTGNSQICAKFLAERLNDECIDSFHFIHDGIAADLITAKPWVFVSPTYAWRLPRIFETFIRAGDFKGSQEAYFIMTCGDDIGDAARYIRPLCEEKGLRFRGVLSVVMPENYLAMFDVPEEKEAAEIRAKARPVIQEAAAWIRQGKVFPDTEIKASDRLKSGPVNTVFYRLFVKAKPFWATTSCTGCGLCVKRCVTNNISLEHGKPVWSDRCTHCMACICGCPAKAIEYGKKSVGKPRYWCKEM